MSVEDNSEENSVGGVGERWEAGKTVRDCRTEESIGTSLEEEDSVGKSLLCH